MDAASEPRVPRRRAGAFALGLAAVLLVCLPPMLVELGRADPTRVMENYSILSSQETWLGLHGGTGRGWLIPQCAGQPRVNKPPLLVWLNLLAWSGLSPESAPVEALVLRARVLGIAFALLAIAATAWAGRRLYNAETGLVAGLAIGTGMLFLRHARIAAYDIHLLGWLALVLAGAAAAMTARSPRGRRGAWALAGVALGAAVLTKGPLAFLLGAGPIAAWIATQPRPRSAAWRGLGLTCATTLLIAAPWYAHVLATVPESAGRMFVEYKAVRKEFQPPWYYLGLVGLVFPWTFAWLRSLPDAVRRGMDRGRDAAWVWFLFVFVAMSIPGAKQQRYILPILPAMALMVARGWMEGGGGADRWRRWMDRAHLGLLVVVSVLAPVFLLVQDRIVAWRWIDRAPVALDAAWVAPLLALALGLAAWTAWAAMRGGRRLAAAWATAGWMTILSTTVFAGLARAGDGADPSRADALGVLKRIGDAPLYYVYRFQADDLPPSKEFLIYTRRVVPSLGRAALVKRLTKGETIFVLARVTPGHEPELEKHGMIRLFDFEDGSRLSMRLYRSASTGGPVSRGAPSSPAGP